MIAGFVALMLAHSRVLPVSDALYPTESQCRTAILRDQQLHPQTSLFCGEVMRSHYL